MSDKKDLDLSETVSLSETVAMEGSKQDAMPFKAAPLSQPGPAVAAPQVPPPDDQLKDMNARIDAMGASAGFADLKKMAEQALLAAQGAFKGKRYELESDRGRLTALKDLATTKNDGLEAFASACFDGDRPLSVDDLKLLRAAVLGLGKQLHARDDEARKRIQQAATLLEEES